MAKRSADKIIESIVHVTGHDDRELLETSLASTLYELFNLDRIFLYKIFYEHNQPQCYLALEVDDDQPHVRHSGEVASASELMPLSSLTESLTTKLPATTQLSDGSTLYSHPIINHLGKISGVFCLCGKDIHSNENERFIDGYFQIYRNYLHLLDESEHDTLTGLLNRRTFDKNLEKILAEWHKNLDKNSPAVKTQPQPLRRQANDKKANWLAVIDIDHFKQVNDQYGHLYGDEVLLLFANIMRDSFRGYDRLFRFGGEEFVVILRTTDLAGAEKALQRFRNAIATYSFPQIDHITASAGFIEIATHAIPAQILGRADEALYYAKQHGRNRVCQYEQLLGSGAITPAPELGNQAIELFEIDAIDSQINADTPKA